MASILRDVLESSVYAVTDPASPAMGSRWMQTSFNGMGELLKTKPPIVFSVFCLQFSMPWGWRKTSPYKASALHRTEHSPQRSSAYLLTFLPFAIFAALR